MKTEGRAWKFGHNIDTDVIAAGKYLYLDIKELATHTLEVHDPEFAKQVKPGDVLVGGRNFGCGSSREHAPRALKVLGIGCVLVESCARIFNRNAIAIGLPILVVPGLWQATEPGDVIAADLSTGLVVNHRTGIQYSAPPMPERLLAVLNEGGILPALKRLAAQSE
jgi:3-isopropylmalate/(R)-2-methylmalate dehydratase small subunit